MNVFLQNPVCKPACLTPAFIQKGFVTDSKEIEFLSEQGNKQKITPAVNYCTMYVFIVCISCLEINSLIPIIVSLPFKFLAMPGICLNTVVIILKGRLINLNIHV